MSVFYAVPIVRADSRILDPLTYDTYLYDALWRNNINLVSGITVKHLARQTLCRGFASEFVV